MTRIGRSLALLVVGLILGSIRLNAQDYRIYRGCVHIHSTYSDGGGSVEEIAQAAQNAGLDYAVLTDHNTLQPLRDGKEGWYVNTLILISTELSLPDGHFLALNLPPDFTWDRNNTQRAINQVNAAGGFGYFAHPISRWPWTNWNVTGFTGMELTNLSSLFHQEGTSQPLRLIGNFMRDYLANSNRAMQRTMMVASDGSLERWSEMIKSRQTVGIGSVDAHALIKIGGRELRIPSYGDIFRSLQIHILVPESFNRDINHDKRLVYSALQNGRCYTAYTIWGDPSGFQYSASRSGQSVVMGQPIAREGGSVTLRVRVPGNQRTTTRIFRGPDRIFSTTLKSFSVPAPVAGAYRAEVDVTRDGRLVPWVISNPIYVR